MIKLAQRAVLSAVKTEGKKPEDVSIRRSIIDTKMPDCGYHIK